MRVPKALDLTYFRQALESDDIRGVKRALEHLIMWHELYHVDTDHEEVGYAVIGEEGITPTNNLYIKGIENEPGVQKYVRYTTDWFAEDSKPLLKGREVNLYGEQMES